MKERMRRDRSAVATPEPTGPRHHDPAPARRGRDTELGPRGGLHGAASATATFDADAALSRVLAHPPVGQPLDSAARAFLEPRFGHSFAHLRVHADAEADRLARSMSANAFTAGRDIYFRAGEYAPGSRDGMHLLAHEAAHTIQQAAGPVAGRPGPAGALVSDPADGFERAAEAIADRVVSDAAPGAGGADSAAAAESTTDAGSAQTASAPGAFVQRDFWDDLSLSLPTWLGGPEMVPASELPPSPELPPAPPVFPIDPALREEEGLPPSELPPSESPYGPPPPLGPADMPAVGPLSPEQEEQYQEWLKQKMAAERGRPRGGARQAIEWGKGGETAPVGAPWGPRPPGPPPSHVGGR